MMVESNCSKRKEKFPCEFGWKTLPVVLEYLSDPRYSSLATTTNAEVTASAFAPQLYKPGRDQSM